MKKLALLLVVLFITASCKNNGEYNISGSIAGMKDGTLYLEKQSENGMGTVAVDTIKIVDGKFEIKGKVTEATIHFIQIDSLPGKVPFILEGGDINVTVDKDSIQKSKMSGTYSNDELYKFNTDLEKLQKIASAKSRKFQADNMTKMNEAQQSNDTVTMNSLRKQYQKLMEDSKVDQDKVTDYLKNYPNTHPKSYISLLIVESMINNPEMKIEEVEKQFKGLDKSLTETTKGKKVLVDIDLKKNSKPN